MCEPVGISYWQSIRVPWMTTAVIPLGSSSSFAGAAEALGDAAAVPAPRVAGVDDLQVRRWQAHARGERGEILLHGGRAERIDDRDRLAASIEATWYPIAQPTD